MREHTIINHINILIDGVLVYVSYLIATYIRFGLMYGSNNALSYAWNPSFLIAALIYTFVILFLLYLNNIYTTKHYPNIADKIIKIIIINTVAILILTTIIYFYLISTILLSLKTYIFRKLSVIYFSRKENHKHIIVIGNGILAQEFIDSLEMNSNNYVVDGYISYPKDVLSKKIDYLGKYEDVIKILENPNIEEVVVALEYHEYNFMPIILEACEKAGTKISIIPSYHRFIPSKPYIQVINNFKLFNLREIPLDDLGRSFVKRLVDVIGSIFAIIVFSPFMLFAVMGIKLTMPGPLIFKQKRLGKNKKVFNMYKFRSMKLNDFSDTAWSGDNDQRRTKFGKIIRKFSIDELPQLFNVLKGDMSLVGPRPEIPHYIVKFKEEVPLYMIRNQVKPGMTGWAQVHGLRGDTSIEERVKYDIWYIENWSLWLDIKILLKTIFGGMINSEKIN